MKTYFGYISLDKKSSLFGYELSLRKQGCRPIKMGIDDKKYYALYRAENKPKGLGRNKEVIEGTFYVIPNQVNPTF